MLTITFFKSLYMLPTECFIVLRLADSFQYKKTINKSLYVCAFINHLKLCSTSYFYLLGYLLQCLWVFTTVPIDFFSVNCFKFYNNLRRVYFPQHFFTFTQSGAVRIKSQGFRILDTIRKLNVLRQVLL